MITEVKEKERLACIYRSLSTQQRRIESEIAKRERHSEDPSPLLQDLKIIVEERVRIHTNLMEAK
jgi:hypothetical protein